MNSPSLLETLKQLKEEERENLKKKLPPFYSSRKENWQREGAQLGFSSLYSAPASFLSEELSEKGMGREVFWILLFLFLWQEKGHSSFPLSLWQSWLDDNLKEQERLLLASDSRREFLGEFKEIAIWIIKKVGRIPALKEILQRNPQLVSWKDPKKSPLFWDKHTDNLSFSKLKEKEERFIVTFSRFLKKTSFLPLALGEEKLVLDTLKKHLNPFFLSSEQETVITKALQSPFLCISGGPGTGKTTTVVSLLRAFIALWQGEHPPRLGLCAPTGLAAMRLKDSLSLSLEKPFIWQGKLVDETIPRKPKTLQSLLALSYRNPCPFNESHSLPFDLVLVDESSMLDLSLLQTLLEALSPQAKLILVGDPHQLPPVDLGAPFADLVWVTGKKDGELCNFLATLSNNFRFKSNQTLKDLSLFLLAGKAQEFIDTLLELDEENPIQYKNPSKPYLLAPELYASFWQGKEKNLSLSKQISAILKNAPFYLGQEKAEDPVSLREPLSRSIILSAQNVGSWGINRLNEFLLEEHRKQLRNLYKSTKTKMPLLGVPVMVTLNRPDLELFNGERGLIFYTSQDPPIPYACFYQEGLWRSFPLASLADDWTLSFCCTIHKSQGSEYSHVVLLLAEESPLLSRELLYTAITRTKNSLDLYSTNEVLEKALGFSSLRYSGLRDDLTCL